MKEGDDPLAALEVLDRLEVGPVRVMPDRMLAPYTVSRDGRTETFELSYKYEEPVFDPADPASLNLASVTAAQVALNYGLFCKELVLHGPLDATDRRFLKDMARNTAREIYVVKFLMPNPFIVGGAAKLPAVRRRSYLRADVVFPEAIRGRRGKGTGAPAGHPDRSRYVVMSSGGKDSLLSFGLLDEMGAEVHPVFVNESGRHWFTALNAYRNFKGRYPNTGRVWTNADRLFSWMLRRLPFVRGDFSDVRSDEYPLRLWTVAVFIFGALPLVRKRGAGRIVVGDEHDTTARLQHEGITHYNGLYDQSRYFDEALTRYYMAKGWGISQFSLLRPMSELLIEKTLVERYPDLQRNQVSCHATHTEGDRVLPCGQCEKCRRIMAMLVVLGADPEACGYTPEQLASCMDTVHVKGVHQERAGVEHLAFLMYRRGILQGPTLGGTRPHERPEVMALRFHRERSPPDWIPYDIREPLLRILMEHANSALVRAGRRWLEVDPWSDPAFAAPYRLEGPLPKTIEEGVGSRPSSWYKLGEMTWPEAQEHLREMDLAILPVGSLEQHGPHLPLDTDGFDAEHLAHLVAGACTEPKPIVLPLIPYGVSYHHEDFEGTVSITPDTLSKLVYEIGMNLARQGIAKLVVINGHAGNTPALKFAAQMINRDAHIFTIVDTGESSDTDISAIVETEGDAHSGEIETSTALATRPHLVHLEQARRWVPEFSSRYLDFSSGRSVEWFARTARFSPSGVLGDPTKATVEKGRRIWAVMVRNLVELVEHLKGMSLDEIFERRY
jgi:creatinine amidohydrolase/Fe(II)-dependent formamide hydrolase-like protein